MKIFDSIISGARSAFKAWKGILITWILTIILVSIIAVPLRSALKSAFGSSMITEKLAQGFNIEVFTDLGATFKVLMSFFSTGLIFLMFIGFLLNIFLAGGLFSFLRKGPEVLTSSEFFKTSARNFWSFLAISVIVRFLLNILTGITLAVPILIISTNDSISLNTSIIIASISLFASVIVIAIMLLVADYSRAWHVSNGKLNCFSALGFGFSETFRTFWSSLPLMVLVLIIQVLFICLVFLIISGWLPSTGGALFLLFITSQLLFFVRIFIKVWRFGSVTALMEINKNIVPGFITENPL